MGSAGRMGFDLTTRVGWRNLWYNLRWYRCFPRLAWKDTFGRVLCWLAGEHSIRQDWDNGNGTPSTSCTTCCQWLEQDGYNWRAKR